MATKPGRTSQRAPSAEEYARASKERQWQRTVRAQSAYLRALAAKRPGPSEEERFAVDWARPPER